MKTTSKLVSIKGFQVYTLWYNWIGLPDLRSYTIQNWMGKMDWRKGKA
jgi:hypothetical protein